MKNTIPWTDAWSFEDYEGWTVTGEESHVLKMDLREKTIEYVCTASNCGEVIRRFSQILYHENKVYLFPDRCNSIEIYDLNLEKWMSVKICSEIESLHNRFRIVTYWKEDNFLWLFSATQKRLICFDLMSDTVVKGNEIVLTEDSDEILWDYSAEKTNDTVYILGRNNKIMYEINLSNKTVTKMEIDVDDFLGAYSFDGKDFWITGQNKKLYIWNKYSGLKEIIELPSESIFKEDERSRWPDFIYNWISKDSIWLIPARTDKVLRINRSSKIISEEIFENTNVNSMPWLATPLQIRFKENYYRESRYLGIYSFESKRIIEIDAYNDEWKYVDSFLADRSFLIDKCFVQEDDLKDINTFISRIISG